MPSGGYRPGAGRPKKSPMQKLLDGNPGKRPLMFLDFSDCEELPSVPPKWLTNNGKEVYREVREWLAKIGCLKGIMPYHLEEYAHCRSRWKECEDVIMRTSVLSKEIDVVAVATLAEKYMNLTNVVWQKIFATVRESKLKTWDMKTPNDECVAKF